MGSQKRNNGEVVFQHIWQTTAPIGNVERPRMSWWYPVKAVVLVVWFFAALGMVLGYDDMTVLQFCALTMFTGLASCLPSQRKRKYSIDRDSFHPNKF